MSEQPSLRATILFITFMVTAIVAGGFLSYFVGGYLFEVAGNYMPSGDNTTLRDFIMPFVYSVLFFLPFMLLKLLPVILGERESVNDSESSEWKEIGLKKILRFDVDAIQSRKSIRLWFLGLMLRLALWAGHPVVLIGACRTGKTLLLNKLASNIIDKQPEAINSGRSEFPLDVAEIPKGIFGIDEGQLIAPPSRVSITQAMAKQQRVFVLCSQRFRYIEGAINAYRRDENSKSLVIVVMGGHRNPQTILDELPQEQS